MLYMVELHYEPQRREAALRYFFEHGTTHHNGKVTIQSVWVATQDGVAYALLRSAEESEVEKACEPLAELGKVVTRHVTSTDVI